MNTLETLSALSIITTFFPHTFEISDDAMVIAWQRELAEFPFPDVEAAVRDLCRTKEKFPSLKDVLDRLGANRSATDGWRKACKYFSEWGSGAKVTHYLDEAGNRVTQVLQPPGIQDPAMLAAIEAIGGKDAIRSRNEDSEPAMRAHFFRAFEEAARANITLPSGQTQGKVGPGNLANAMAAIGKPMSLPPLNEPKREGTK